MMFYVNFYIVNRLDILEISILTGTIKRNYSNIAFSVGTFVVC